MDTGERDLVRSDLPPRKPFNIRLLLAHHLRGFHPDYKRIREFFSHFQSRPVVTKEGWAGFDFLSGEFERGIRLGDRKTVRTKSVATQTDDFMDDASPASTYFADDIVPASLSPSAWGGSR